MVYAVLSGGPHRIYDTFEEAMAGINKHAYKRNSYWIKGFASRYDAQNAIDDRDYEVSVQKGRNDRNHRRKISRSRA